MDDVEFDSTAIQAVLEQAGLRGWADVNLVEAAQDAGLDPARLRRRFPSRAAVLLRFGTQADEAALAGAGTLGTPREKLFDLVMNRFEALQAHRAGVKALLAALRTDPGTSMLLYAATLRSMTWLLEGAGVPATGITGALRTNGLMAVWLYSMRAWEKDESADLSGTMAAVDRALDRAMQAERSMPWSRAAGEAASLPSSPPVAEPTDVDTASLPDTSPNIL